MGDGVGSPESGRNGRAGAPLSGREREVARLYVDGQSYKEIARGGFQGRIDRPYGSAVGLPMG